MRPAPRPPTLRLKTLRTGQKTHFLAPHYPGFPSSTRNHRHVEYREELGVMLGHIRLGFWKCVALKGGRGMKISMNHATPSSKSLVDGGFTLMKVL